MARTMTKIRKYSTLTDYCTRPLRNADNSFVGGTAAAYICKDIPRISDIVTIIITIPLIFIVIKYISPYIIRLKNESKTIISMFFLLPLTYYILEYAFTVYTDLLYRGEAVVIEFMDSFIVILYFILSTVILALLNKKNTAERENIILLAAAAQAEKEIAQLSDYQKQAAIYRPLFTDSTS